MRILNRNILKVLFKLIDIQWFVNLIKKLPIESLENKKNQCSSLMIINHQMRLKSLENLQKRIILTMVLYFVFLLFLMV